MELLTSAQMRAIEVAEIASGRVTGLELMERAGEAVVAAILAEWPRFRDAPGRVAVLCGPGNNGGDGFVVARLLRGLGWGVEVLFFGAADRLPPDARVNHDRWQAMGPVMVVEDVLASPGARDLAVDAGFGIGLTRAIPAEMGRALAQLAPRRVAVDLPSGLCAESGRILAGDGREDGAAADLTVTFHAPKAGHVLAEGPRVTGRLVVADIGLPKEAARRLFPPAELIRKVGPAPEQWAKRAGGMHKYSYGHVLVLAGGAGRGGAARLSARAALRVGAGVVTLACPPEAVAENAARLEAVMLRPCPDGAALVGMLEDRRITALCLGPGLGLGAREAGLVAAVLAAGRACVLDADALTLIAGDGALRARLHPRCVLTPHAGEFARLFPEIAERLSAPAVTGPALSRVDAARQAAARAGCAVLLKGADTVIAGPDGQAAVHAASGAEAAPWLATAGAGDVLAGLIAGLLARGVEPVAAAGQGAWLHAAAARRFGPGLIAEDLPEALPAVFRDAGL